MTDRGHSPASTNKVQSLQEMCASIIECSGLTTQARRFCLLRWALRTNHLNLKFVNKIRHLLRICKYKQALFATNNY